jgi:hypothetical protein
MEKFSNTTENQAFYHFQLNVLSHAITEKKMSKEFSDRETISTRFCFKNSFYHVLLQLALTEL